MTVRSAQNAPPRNLARPPLADSSRNSSPYNWIFERMAAMERKNVVMKSASRVWVNAFPKVCWCNMKCERIAIVMNKKKKRSSTKIMMPMISKPVNRWGDKAKTRAMPLVDILHGSLAEPRRINVSHFALVN